MDLMQLREVIFYHSLGSESVVVRSLQFAIEKDIVNVRETQKLKLYGDDSSQSQSSTGEV